jgi:predicted nucleic acid-binding protein
MTQVSPLLFVDSNVLVESIFLAQSAAATVINLAIKGTFRIVTCQQVIDDVERAIISKLQKTPEDLDTVIQRWELLKVNSRLAVTADESLESANRVYHEYIMLMRHKADIPILAAAIKLRPSAILSGNREHFNDKVAHKYGIAIFSCAEFLDLIAQHKT